MRKITSFIQKSKQKSQALQITKTVKERKQRNNIQNKENKRNTTNDKPQRYHRKTNNKSHFQLEDLGGQNKGYIHPSQNPDQSESHKSSEATIQSPMS